MRGKKELGRAFLGAALTVFLLSGAILAWRLPAYAIDADLQLENALFVDSMVCM